MAAAADIPIIKVLIALHAGMDMMDFAGPLEVLSHAQHDLNDSTTKAFKVAFAAENEHTVTEQGASLRAHMEIKEAYTRLNEFDILIVPGGGVEAVLKSKSEPLGLIQAFSDLQKKYPDKERTLLSVDTGSMLLAQVGILNGLSATTHPDYYTKFEKVCSEACQRDLAERCDVVEERYVVNNLRFDLGNVDENPYVRRKSDARKPSFTRKGSNAWKESNTRRESNARRASLRLGGLRVITTGGITSGLDACLYLVSIYVNEDAATEVARLMQYTWIKGVVVDGIDI